MAKQLNKKQYQKGGIGKQESDQPQSGPNERFTQVNDTLVVPDPIEKVGIMILDVSSMW